MFQGTNAAIIMQNYNNIKGKQRKTPLLSLLFNLNNFIVITEKE